MRSLLAVVLLLTASSTLAQGINNPQTNASALTSGTLAATRGGAGTINGALKANGSGVVSAAACADLSNGGTACTKNTGTSGNTIPFLDGSNTWSALQTVSSGINIAVGGSFAVGSIYSSAANGTSIVGRTGSVNDFVFFTPGGAGFATVPTGTSDWAVVGQLFSGLSSVAQTNVVCFNTVSGRLTYQAFATGCVTSSARYKQDITEISHTRALEIANSLVPVSYQYRPDADLGSERHIGFTAEQVQKVDPTLVGYESDGITPRAVKYQELAPIFAGAIQALKSENDQLRECQASWICRIFNIRSN